MVSFERSEENKQRVIYNDLREYIEIVEELGELRRIDGASWQEDILEILKVTVIRTPGVKAQLILKTGTQT